LRKSRGLSRAKDWKCFKKTSLAGLLIAGLYRLIPALRADGFGGEDS
jgi:hypothetical protein